MTISPPSPWALPLALLLAGCGGTDDGQGDHAATDEPRWGAITSFELTRVAPDGSSPGFDLDERVSPAGDDETCQYSDKRDAEGRPGIDNQLAELTPILEAALGGAVEGLIQGSVNEGRLLLLFRLTEHPPRLVIRRGQGKPHLGTDGMILDHQTFTLADEAPLVDTKDAHISEDAVITARAPNLVLPVSILREEFDLDLQDVQFRLVPDGEGGWQGLLGGGFPVETMVDVAYRSSGYDGRRLEGPLRGLADLERGEDGVCTRMSSALAVKAVPAYVFGPEDAP